MIFFDNIADIDKNQLLLIANDRIINKFTNNLNLGNLSFAEISFYNNIYNLFITNNSIEISVEINRDQVKNIFYKVLSYGGIPRDSKNDNHIISLTPTKFSQIKKI